MIRECPGTKSRFHPPAAWRPRLEWVTHGYELKAARRRRNLFLPWSPVVKTLVILLAFVSLCAGTVLAAPAADAKARGQYNFYGRGARNAMRGARESVGSFREYIRSTPSAPAQIVREQPGVVIVSPRIAQAAVDEIGDYIAKSEKHLAWMRKQAEASRDEETLAALDGIDRHLAAAKKNHATLCGSCLQDAVDATAAMASCQTIDDDLAMVISEHDALMKRLGEKLPGQK